MGAADWFALVALSNALLALVLTFQPHVQASLAKDRRLWVETMFTELLFLAVSVVATVIPGQPEHRAAFAISSFVMMLTVWRTWRLRPSATARK